MDAGVFTSFQTKLQVRGGKNQVYLFLPPSPTRKVMTLEILKIVGHEIAIADWCSDSKRVFWAACCLLFFGSFRVGEIFSVSKKKFSTEGSPVEKCRTDFRMEIEPFRKFQTCIFLESRRVPSSPPLNIVFTSQIWKLC